MLSRRLLRANQLGFPISESYIPTIGDIGTLGKGDLFSQSSRDELPLSRGEQEKFLTELDVSVSKDSLIRTQGVLIAEANGKANVADWFESQLSADIEMSATISSKQESMALLKGIEISRLKVREHKMMLRAFGGVPKRILEPLYVVTGVRSASFMEMVSFADRTGTFDLRAVWAKVRGNGSASEIVVERWVERRVFSVTLGRFDWKNKYADLASHEDDDIFYEECSVSDDIKIGIISLD